MNVFTRVFCVCCSLVMYNIMTSDVNDDYGTKDVEGVKVRCRVCKVECRARVKCLFD